jgi:hypothetical protein
MTQLLKLDFTFPHNYEVKVLKIAPPVQPLEKLHHFPVELEEGDRSGAYLRVMPRQGKPWTGFFVLGFESELVVNSVCSCPDPDTVCAIVGGYSYVVKAADPTHWFRLKQRPVVDVRAVPDLGLLVFVGFTEIAALDAQGVRWSSDRLSWEGISITAIKGEKLLGLGWDAIADQEVPFDLDLLTGKHSGGARPGITPPAGKEL